VLPVAGGPRDYLTACLALLLAESPGSADALTLGLAGLGLGATDRSAVCQALVVMEAEGVVEVADEHGSTRAARRTYRLTSDGVCWLRRWGLRAPPK
jgi:DNA-binding PadR family transcriptional regulator